MGLQRHKGVAVAFLRGGKGDKCPGHQARVVVVEKNSFKPPCFAPWGCPPPARLHLVRPQSSGARPLPAALRVSAFPPTCLKKGGEGVGGWQKNLSYRSYCQSFLALLQGAGLLTFFALLFLKLRRGEQAIEAAIGATIGGFSLP